LINLRRALWPLLLLVALALAAFYLANPVDDEGLAAQVRTTPVSIEGFARATGPRPFDFPADFGPHPDYRTEWWYFTGNVATANGRHFGFELTFFRLALAAGALPLDGASAWRADQVWMAHFALTDSAGGRFVARERLARRQGPAGAGGAPSYRLGDQTRDRLPPHPGPIRVP